MARKSDEELKAEERLEKAEDRRAVAGPIAKVLGDRVKSCSRPDTLVRLAGVLKVPIEQLIAGFEWIPDGTGSGELKIEEPKPPGDDKSSVDPEQSG